MSSGHYNFNPKIQFQNTVLPQMTSDVYLPSFHFGASQVPHALNEKHEFIGIVLAFHRFITENIQTIWMVLHFHC